MRKYAGCITIFDDEGNTIFTRELTADQMIELLAQALANPAVSEPEIEPEPEPVLRHPKAGKGKQSDRRCGNCGRPGHSRRTCEGIEQSPTFVTPLTEDEWDQVKDMVDQDMSAVEIANELGVPLAKVNVAIPYSTYDAYRKARTK